MIPAKNSNIEVQGNIQGEDVAMTIDEASLAHIMDTMINLYTDTEAAPLREVATNAYDAHIAAGNTAPIEITLPSPLASFLTVRDYGIGLNADDIRNIYSKYGASTKRDTDDQVGMLGFGCKSPLAYTSQFTLVGVKDGIQTTVNISRDEDDGGTMTILDESPTDEPNGVTVTIPAKRSNSFAEKARDLFKYWPAGSVLVNGQEPERITGLNVTDEIMICNDGYYEDDIIVMGNVAYPIGRSDLNHNLGTNYNVVAFVPIGSVNPVPSREGLKDGKLKKIAIESIKQVLKDRLPEAIQRNIETADNAVDAFRTASEFRRLIGKKDTLVYNGNEIPTAFRVGDDDPRFVITTVGSRPISRCERTKSLNAGYLTDDSSIFVHGYDRPSFTPTQKKKLEQWADEEGLRVERFILNEDKNAVDTQWLNPCQIVEWSEINAIKLPRRSSAGGGVSVKAVPASYEAYVEGSFIYEVAADDIDTTDLYYINTSSFEHPRALALLLAKHRPSSTIVLMPTNRIGKFTRSFPMALPVIDELKNIYEVELVTRVTDEDIIADNISNDWRLLRNCRSLDPDQIDDPKLARFVRIAEVPCADHMASISNFLIYRWDIGIHSPITESEIEDPFDNYPLFDYNANQDHLHFYVNAVFAARKDS